MHRERLTGIAGVFILLSGAGLVTAGENRAPSNLSLIAAMPPKTESVIVYRDAELAAEGSVLKHEMLGMHDGLGQEVEAEKHNEPLNIVLRYVAMSTPLIHALGGSRFTMETDSEIGVGVGKYDERSVWCVEKPLTPLMKRLAAVEDIEGQVKPLSIGDTPAYETEVGSPDGRPASSRPANLRQCFAFPSDRVVLIAQDRTELEYMLKALGTKGKPVMPARWKDFAVDLNVESPILLLREYDPANEKDYYSPVNPKRPARERADIRGLGIALPSVKDPLFRLRCVTRDAQAAAGFYQLLFFAPRSFGWSVQIQKTGFSADIRVRNERKQEAPITLLLLMLYGANVFL